MAIAKGTLYTRIVPQDKNRGYVMMASWSKPVNQRTCDQMTTLGAISREYVNQVTENLREHFGADEVVDTTDESLRRKLAKQFGELDK